MLNARSHRDGRSQIDLDGESKFFSPRKVVLARIRSEPFL